MRWRLLFIPAKLQQIYMIFPSLFVDLNQILQRKISRYLKNLSTKTVATSSILPIPALAESSFIRIITFAHLNKSILRRSNCSTAKNAPSVNRSIAINVIQIENPLRLRSAPSKIEETRLVRNITFIGCDSSPASKCWALSYFLHRLDLRIKISLSFSAGLLHIRRRTSRRKRAHTRPVFLSNCSLSS